MKKKKEEEPFKLNTDFLTALKTVANTPSLPEKKDKKEQSKSAKKVSK